MAWVSGEIALHPHSQTTILLLLFRNWFCNVLFCNMVFSGSCGCEKIRCYPTMLRKDLSSRQTTAQITQSCQLHSCSHIWSWRTLASGSAWYLRQGKSRRSRSEVKCQGHSNFYSFHNWYLRLSDGTECQCSNIFCSVKNGVKLFQCQTL